MRRRLAFLFRFAQRQRATLTQSQASRKIGAACGSSVVVAACALQASCVETQPKPPFGDVVRVQSEWESWHKWQEQLHPTPIPGEPVQLWSSTAVNRCPRQSGAELLVMATVSAARQRADIVERPPVNIVVVVDSSVDMVATRASLKYIVSEMQPQDHLRLVTFGTAGARSGFDDIFKLSAIDAAMGGSASDLHDGLMMGVRALLPSSSNEACCSGEAPCERHCTLAVCLVLVGARGMASTGDSARILQEIADFRNDTGSTAPVHSFGFGDASGTFLAKLGMETGGTYFCIESVDDIPLAFGQCVGGLFATVAQHVDLDFFPAAGVQFCAGGHGVSSTRVWNYIPGSGDEPSRYKLELGELSEGERRDSLLTLSLPALKDTDANCSDLSVIGHFVATYYDLVKEERRELAAEAAVVRPVDASVPFRDIAVDEQRNLAEVVRALSRAREFCEAGDCHSASRALRDCSGRLDGSLSGQGPFVRGLAASLAGAEVAVSSVEAYRQWGCGYLRSHEQSHARQRASGVSGPGGYLSPAGLRGMVQAQAIVPQPLHRECGRRLAAARPNFTASMHVPAAKNARIAASNHELPRGRYADSHRCFSTVSAQSTAGPSRVLMKQPPRLEKTG